MKKLILLIALLTSVAFASGVMAQQAKPATTPAPAPAKAAATPAKEVKPKIEKFSGAIEKVDEMTKTIVIKDKKGEKTFGIDEKTKIIKGKDTLSFADLKKGMNVSTEYKKDGDKMVAVAIKVAAPKAAPKKEEIKK